MDYRCTECRWSTDDSSTDDPGATAIRHYVETGHSVEQYSTTVAPTDAHKRLETPSD